MGKLADLLQKRDALRAELEARAARERLEAVEAEIAEAQAEEKAREDKRREAARAAAIKNRDAIAERCRAQALELAQTVSELERAEGAVADTGARPLTAMSLVIPPWLRDVVREFRDRENAAQAHG